MNANCRRFLALNCALNGHDFMDAFDGEMKLAVRVLDSSEKEITDLQRQYVLANEKRMLKALYANDIIVALNFMRCSEFAFVYFPTTGPIFLRDFVESDRRDEISNEVREVVLKSLIRDIATVKDERETRIADGVFYTVTEDPAKLMVAIKAAYLVYKMGPKTKDGFNEAVLNARSRLTMGGYRDIPASTCRALLNEILSQGLNPTVYRDSFLQIPDLLPVYKETGALISFISQVPSDQVFWVTDIVGTEKARVNLVQTGVLRSLIVDNLRNLSSIAYDPSKGANGLVVC